MSFKASSRDVVSWFFMLVCLVARRDQQYNEEEEEEEEERAKREGYRSVHRPATSSTLLSFTSSAQHASAFVAVKVSVVLKLVGCCVLRAQRGQFHFSFESFWLDCRVVCVYCKM